MLEKHKTANSVENNLNLFNYEIVNSEDSISDEDSVNTILRSKKNSSIYKGLEFAKNNENVLTYPEPRVRFREFADSGLKFQLLLWIAKPERRGRTVDEINTRIYHQFSEDNITTVSYTHLTLPTKRIV